MRALKKREKCVMRKKALLVTSLFIVIVALVLATVVGCTPTEDTFAVTLNLGDKTEVRNLTDLNVAPVAPTKDGYEFEGWYTDANLQNKATFPMELKSDITLYAKYLQLFTLTLVSMDSENTTQTLTVVKSAPTPPSREGYTFQGWYLDDAYTQAVEYPYQMTDNTTFYAKWTKDTVEVDEYTVIFVTNGGTAVEEFTGTVIETSPVTKKEGYKFGGWYSRQSLSGSPVSFPLILKKNITLYAKWIEEGGEESEYTYINEYRNNKISLETIFDKLPERQRTAVMDIQTTMTTNNGTAKIDLKGNFNVGGKNEFMFRITMLDKTTFALYFVGNEMYMDVGEDQPLIHFSDIKPDYLIAFLGDLLIDLDLGELLEQATSGIGGIDIAGALVNLLFNSPYYSAVQNNETGIIVSESYNFEIIINSLVSGINSLLKIFDIGALVGMELNLQPLLSWLDSTLPPVKANFYVNLEYDESLGDTAVKDMKIVMDDNDPDNDVDGQIFLWVVDNLELTFGNEEDLIEFPDFEQRQSDEFSLSNLQFDIDLNLYTKGTTGELNNPNGLDVAKLINLFAPDLNLPENTLVLNSEFGYRLKANVDLDLNYTGSADDNNLIALEIYAIDKDGNIILNEKVPMLLGIYYRNGSLYVSLNSMMPNYWKANNIRVDNVNLKGVVSYLVEMVTTAIDEYFNTNWDDFNMGSDAQSLSLSSTGRDQITLAEDETTGEDVVYISPTIQTLITAIASVVGFQECVYATGDQIVIEVNQKLFSAINQFMESPIELPIALDGKVALNIFEGGIESVEVGATVGVPDKDAEGNVIKDENGNIVTSDPVDVSLKAHNFLIGFNQKDFEDENVDSLAEFIDSKISLTTYDSNLGNLLGSVLSGVDLNARAEITFNQGTYAIGKFLSNLGLKQVEGMPLEWEFTQDFHMNVALSIMISIDKTTRSNSMFAIEITAIDDISVGGITGMDAGTVIMGVYGFYTQDMSGGGTGEWKPHILLDLTNVKIMNITLPKLSIEFDFVQTLLDLFDNIKIGDQLLTDFDLEFDIMSLFGSEEGSGSGEVSESALFAESDGTAAGTELSDYGMIIFGLNAEKIYAEATLAAVGNLLEKAGVSLGDFDLGAINLALSMDITRTEGWTIDASGNFMQPEESDQSQNFKMAIEIGTKEYPLTVGYVRDKLNETKKRVEADVENYTDDLIQAIINTIGVMSIDVEMNLNTYDSHIDFKKIINNILIAEGQYLDLPIDLYLDDWASTSTVTLKWDLDLETITNSKLLLEFKYGEKNILSLGITGGEIVIDLSGLGLFSFKMTNSNLVGLLIGYIDKMIADIGDLNLSDIINGLLTPEEDVNIDEVADSISQSLALAEPAANEGGDSTMELITMLLSGLNAQDVNLYLNLTAGTIDKIFRTLLGIGLGFDINADLGLDMVNGEIDLDLGLSDVVDFSSSFKLQVGGNSDISVDTSVVDINAATGETMAKTLLDSLDIALSIDILNNNIDTGGNNKYLRLSVEKLKAQRVLSDAAESPTIPAGAFLVTIARVNADGDFNDTSVTSNTKSLAYIVLNYNAKKMSIYLAKGNISLVVDFGDYVAIDVDLDLIGTLGPVFQNLIDQIDTAAASEEQSAVAANAAENEPTVMAEGDTTTEEPSPFAELFADLDVLKLLNGGIDVRLTSAGVFNIDVSFNAYEINRIIDGVMSLVFGRDTILNLSELAPDMFTSGTNYLANVNWDRVNSSGGFWETLKSQLTPLLREVLSNMVSSALAPLVTDTLLNSTYEEIHDILMRLLPFPVFNRFNVGINTLDGTFANIYIKGYDDNQPVVDENGNVLTHTSYYGSQSREITYDKGRNSNYKTEIYLFNKSASVGQEDNTVDGASSPGIVDWGDITRSVNFEPYEYSGDNATAYSELFNKYFANKTARYQYNATVQKSNVTFYIATMNELGELVRGAELKSTTMDLLNVGQISKDAAANSDVEATVRYVIAVADFAGNEKTLDIRVNILPATEIRSIEPIETHAYDDIVDDITINLATGVSRSIRTEEMTMFSYAADTYLEHTKDNINVTFKNGVTKTLTVHFLDSTVVDIVGSSEPNTFEIDLYGFTEDNRNIDPFTPEYLYIKYSDGATSRIKVDEWKNTENANSIIGNKAQNDMSSVNVPVQALIAQSTAAKQTVTLTVNIKTKDITALGLGSTLNSLQIDPYTYFLNKIGYSENSIKPETAIAYYYEESTGQSYNEQVYVDINITSDKDGNQFNEANLSYTSVGKYGGTVTLDTTKYGEKMGVDPDTEGYDALANGYFKWSEEIDVNVVKNTIIGVYFDKELTQQKFTVHPYEYNALDDAGKLAYFPDTAYVKFSSNTVMEMPIRWYDGSGQIFDPTTYVPDYESYSEQWQVEIGFLTEEYRVAAIANGISESFVGTFEQNFLQKANVGVFVDGMAIEKLNIAGAGSGDDYYEVNPIDVLYLGKDPFPSQIEVTYTDGSKATIGVYEWEGADNIDISMDGSDVREITVKLTKDNLNNYTIRYKVVAKEDPVYAYDELVLDPFGYITVENNGQKINTYREFGTTLDVQFKKPETSAAGEIMPLDDTVYTVNVKEWNLDGITLSSGSTGTAIAKVLRSDGTTIDVAVPVRMKTIATRDSGEYDISYQYYGYDFVVVMYDTVNDVYFSNFSEEIANERYGNIDLTMRYRCEEDLELYTGEITDEVRDDIVEIVGEDGKKRNYIKVYKTRTISVSANLSYLPQNATDLGVIWYYLDEDPSSEANKKASKYTVFVTVSDCGGTRYASNVDGRVCVMGASTSSADATTDVTEGI